MAAKKKTPRKYTRHHYENRVPAGHGTIAELSVKTKIGVRQLYRLRDQGVFGKSYQMGPRTVYYDLVRCDKAIEMWSTTGVTAWPIP